MEPYEILEHTADIGIRAYGKSREELFIHMAMGMFSLIVPPEEVGSKLTVPIKVQATGWDNLLVSWLQELLVLFDTQGILGSSFEIKRLEPTQLEAVLHGEKLDLKRHSVDKEVKAVTWCDLAMSEDARGVWTAEVIFDI